MESDTFEIPTEEEHLRQRLAKVLKPDSIEYWLNTEVPSLDGRRPIEIIEGGDQAEIEELYRLVSRIESPGAV